MKKFAIVFAFIIIHFSSQVIACDKIVSIKLGDAEVKIPVPVEFCEASMSSIKIKRTFEHFVNPENRLLSVFLTNDNMQKLERDEDPLLNKYMTIQVFREFEGRKISKRKFKRIVRKIKKQQNKIAKEAVHELDDYLKNLKVSDLPKSIYYSDFDEIRLLEYLPKSIYYSDFDEIRLLESTNPKIFAESEHVDRQFDLVWFWKKNR